MTEKNSPWFPYVVSLLSFIPLAGVLVGALCIIYGISRGDRHGKLIAAIGGSGILLSIILYGGLFAGAKSPKSIFATLQRRMLSEQTLPDFIQKIEYYHIQNGRYPRGLDQLSPIDQQKVELQNSGTLTSQGEFFYRLDPDGKHYALLVTGPDHLPFTADDIFPNISPQEAGKIGYRKAAVR
jgi:hypothetical protein